MHRLILNYSSTIRTADTYYDIQAGTVMTLAVDADHADGPLLFKNNTDGNVTVTDGDGFTKVMATGTLFEVTINSDDGVVSYVAEETDGTAIAANAADIDALEADMLNIATDLATYTDSTAVDVAGVVADLNALGLILTTLAAKL